MDWLVVGLGNPGASYARHRHNVGFMIVTALMEAFSLPPFQKRDRSAFSMGTYEGLTLGLALPMAYMNLSGQAIAPLIRFYKVPLERVVVIHDELDLPCGTLRFKRGGGAAGHNGLRDIDAHVGNNYARIRVGIDHPGHRSQVSDYVLQPFTLEQQPLIQRAQDTVLTALPALLLGDEETFKQHLRA